MSRLSCLCVLVLSVMLTASAQERVTGGPPPEIRNHISSFFKAYNSGSADEWEQFAQAHFAPAALKQRTADQRKQFFERLRKDLGPNIAMTEVLREGPDEPLNVHIRTASGSEAVVEMDLESDAPYLITGLRLRRGGPSQNDSGVPPAPVNGQMSDDDLSRALDGYFQKLVSGDVFSGVVLVAKDGKPVYEKPYGLADRANRIANTTSTRFNLGSINKKFTQTAIAQLVARGKLSLTDTVGKLLPDYPQELTRAATVDQLLNHRAGVADFFGDEFARSAKDGFRSNADYFRLVSHEKPLFAPGSRNQYCNGCYIVLGAIIERVSGLPYEKYVEENIFRPAGMDATGAFQSDGIVSNIAMGYTRRSAGGDGPLHSNVFMRGAAGSAAGGGFSTVRDLLAFTLALRQNRIPDVKPDDGQDMIAGGAPGTNSVLAESGHWTVIVLTNLDPPTGEQIGSSLARALAR